MDGPSESPAMTDSGTPAFPSETAGTTTARFDPRDLIPEPIFCVSGEGWILWMNAAAEELTGRAAREVVGNSFATLFSEEDRRRLARPFLRNRRQGNRDFYCEIPIPCASGGSRWIGMRVRLAKNTQGHSAYVCAGHDLHDLHSELEASQIRIKELKARLDGVTASAEMRGDYLTSLSYELRAPMNGLAGMSRLMLDTQLDPEQRTIGDILQNSTMTLMQLVDDMMDFAKIESGQLEIEHHDFDLRVAMDTVSTFLAPAFNEVQLSFSSRIHHRVPSRLKGDAGRLRQIIRCLCTALQKHTEHGEVRMMVELESETAHQASVRFAFARGVDGQSVPLPASFQPFSQVGDAFLVGDRGSSLALAMARRLVHLMGGTCGIERRAEEDLGLWLLIPFTKQAEIKAAIVEPISSETLAGMRVLVADPARADRETTVQALSQAGCQCEEAENGSEALASIRTASTQGRPFAVCFLERDLPEMDSETIAQHLRENGDLGHTCLIQTTSLGRRGDAASAENAGFWGYIVKPMPDEDLRGTALEVLRRHRAAVEQGTPPTPDEGQIVTRHSVAESRRRQTRILLVEDNPLDQLVVSMVLQRIGYRPDMATGYDAAVQALQAQRYDLVLMDVVLPDHTGWDLTTLVRGGEGPNRDTPIIAVTGRISDEDRNRCLEMGMNDFLSKPIDLETLATAVERWSHAETPAPAETPPSEPETNGHVEREEVVAEIPQAPVVMPAAWWTQLEGLLVLDEERLSQSSMGNPEIRTMLVDAFFERLREPASRLRQALDDGNANQARIESHSMKGMCASLGAQRCAEIYAAIEECVDSGRLDGLGSLLDRGEQEMLLVERALTPDQKAA